MMKKEFKALPENRIGAVRELRIEREVPVFTLYLNYAVNNICEITGIDENLVDENMVAAAVQEKDPSVLERLANFLWLFKIDDPQRDFADSRKITLAIVQKIFALRNFFAHMDKPGIQPLLGDRDLYVLLEGHLMPLARENALQPGFKTDKLFKLKLMNKHNISCNDYEFTRKGLIFLICLALYRDDAMEFCHLFDDMKLPVKCPNKIDPNDCGRTTCLAAGGETKTCNIAKAKALIAMFTFFSFRKGRDLLNAEDNDFMCFADIVGYLNKVPTASMDYLALQQEKDKLMALRDASTESDENKEFKYTLHRRFRDRFLSLATAYCEDFDVLPALKFKRLDISGQIGRKRYCYGKESDNRVRMDRHYAIENDAIRFAFEPSEHYGPIHIDALHSSVGAAELKRIMLVERYTAGVMNQQIREYFAAYHRILETMLNADDCCELYLDDATFLKDFAMVTGAEEEELKSGSFQDILVRYFPENLFRFFTGEDKMLTPVEMKKELCGKLQTLQIQAVDFLRRIEKLNEWKRMSADNRPSHPVCGRDEVKNPPRNCRFSDGTLIAKIFDLLNLHLKPEDKFRQLPRGKQHRGMQDYEYQLVHAAIGKFNLDQRNLWTFLEKLRPGLANIMNELKKRVDKHVQQEFFFLRTNPRYDKNGKPVRVSATLPMLASAAAEMFRETCKSEAAKWGKISGDKLEQKDLRDACRRFGVRTGMPLDRESLIKTILRIDIDKWNRAFNDKEKRPYENRSLDEAGHVVSQIPFPNGFAARIISTQSGNKNISSFFDKQGLFDFNRAFKSFPAGKVGLLDFYATGPLIGYMKTHDRKETSPDPDAAGINPGSKDENGRLLRNTDFSAPALDKAIRTIKDVENQDKLLLWFVMKYWDRFQKSETFLVDKVKFQATTSVYDYFNTPIVVEKGLEGIRLMMMPNDVNRPVFTQVRKYAKEIAASMDPSGQQKEFQFYDMMMAFRRIQAEDRAKRLELIPLLQRFEEPVVIPRNAYEGKKSKEEKQAMEFQYYSRSYAAITREEYEILADTRNAVYHNGIRLDIALARRILGKYMPPPRSGKRF